MPKPKKSLRIPLIIFVVLLVLCLCGLMAIPMFIMRPMINQHMDVTVYSPSEFGVDAQALTLTTDDGLSLVSWMTMADNPKGVVILLSGIQNPSVTAFFSYAGMLADHGYASLLIEMRGHGDSQGYRVSLGMEEWLDVKAGVDYLKSTEDFKDLPTIVWGTSMGGTTAINAIGEIPEIDGIISCSAFSSWSEVFCDNMINMGVPSFITALDKPFIDLYLGFSYGFDKLRINPKAEIQKLNGRPALLMHSTGDSQVPFENFNRIMQKAPRHVETFVREGDHHFIIYDEYQNDPLLDDAFSSTVLNFLKKHFE